MIYSDNVKAHWLEKIEEEKDRFNPDCGNNLSGIDNWTGAPQHVLINQFGEVSHKVFEKEFQLPNWITSFMTSYYHEICPAKSYEIIKQLFESVPTYTCLEPIRHKLSIKWLCRLQTEVGLQYASTFNHTTNMGRPYYLGECVGTAIIEHQLALKDPKYKYSKTHAISGVAKIMMEIMTFLNDKDGSGATAVQCLTEGWIWNAPEYYAMAHKQMKTGKSMEQCWDDLWDDLINILKEYK